MKDEQQVLFELMCKFDKICRDNGIVYYLGGGTALGAVRHGGFLPWDDDVDLYITRENYNKIIEKHNFFSKEGIEIVDNLFYRNYFNTVIRCVGENSTMITKARIVDGTPKGQFVELFILDPIPVNNAEKELWLKKHWIYCELFCKTFLVANNRLIESIDKSLYEEYLRRVSIEGESKVLNELHYDLFSIDEKDAVEFCSRWGLRNLIYNIEWFGAPRYIPFESTLLPVPQQVERVLRFDYGDSWRVVPRVENQVNHSMVTSLNIDYSWFVKDYSYFIDAQEVYDIYPKRKEKLLKVFFAKLETSQRKQEIKKSYVQYTISIETEKLGSSKILFERKQYGALRQKYYAWYESQFSDLFYKSKTVLFISSEDLFYALIPLLIDGEYAKVRTILSWHDKIEYDERLVELKAFVDNLYEAYSAMDTNDYEGLKHSLGQCKSFSLSSEQFDYLFLYCYKSIMFANDNLVIENSIKQRLEFLINEYPGRGELLFLKASVMKNEGDEQSQKDLYYEAANNTRDGIIHRMIEHELNELGESIDIDYETNNEDNQSVNKRLMESQVRVIELLNEIDFVCKKNGIRYFLYGQTALFAFRSKTFETDSSVIDIAMFIRDIFSVRDELLNKYRDRIFVSPLSINEGEPFFSYVDTSTTRIFINGAGKNRNPGLKVRIRPIISQGGEKVYSRFLHNGALEEKGARRRGVTIKGKVVSKIRQRIYTGLPTFYETCLEKAIIQNENENRTNNCFIRNIKWKKLSFMKELFENDISVVFEGRNYYIPADYETYFDKLFGSLWKKKTISSTHKKGNMIIDVNNGFDSILKHFRNEYISLDVSKEQEKEADIRKELRPYNDKLMHYWNIVLRSGARVNLWQRYMPLKDELTKLREEGDWEKLGVLLDLYNSTTLEFLNLNLPFKFDDLLHEVYLDWLIATGQTSIASLVESICAGTNFPEINIM